MMESGPVAGSTAKRRNAGSTAPSGHAPKSTRNRNPSPTASQPRWPLREDQKGGGQGNEGGRKGPPNSTVCSLPSPKAGERFRMESEAAAGQLHRNLFDVGEEGRQSLDGVHHLAGGVAQPSLGAAVLAHPILDQGLRQRPDVEVGIEAAADAFGHQHVLL